MLCDTDVSFAFATAIVALLTQNRIVDPFYCTLFNKIKILFLFQTVKKMTKGKFM